MPYRLLHGFFWIGINRVTSATRVVHRFYFYLFIYCFFFGGWLEPSRVSEKRNVTMRLGAPGARWDSSFDWCSPALSFHRSPWKATMETFFKRGKTESCSINQNHQRWKGCDKKALLVMLSSQLPLLKESSPILYLTMLKEKKNTLRSKTVMKNLEGSNKALWQHFTQSYAVIENATTALCFSRMRGQRTVI